MSNFDKFAALVHAQFLMMSEHELFVIDCPADDVFEAYLNSFPEGTNEIFRERTEHDCSCCKHFVRNIGNLVAIIDGKRVSIWDIPSENWVSVNSETTYLSVATSMMQYLETYPIKSIFRTKERKYGNVSTNELRGNVTHKWWHFHAKIANRHFDIEPSAEIGHLTTTAQILRSGLELLSYEATDTVVDLIKENSLYRGEEHINALNAFASMQVEFQNTDDPEIFIFDNINNRYARFKNSVIGTLVQDISQGMDIERAVKAFEAKVAPANYKRPTALITPRMVDDAMKTIESLGLEPSLNRRYAQITDVSVNNVLFVDNTVQGQMIGGIRGKLMDVAEKAPAKIRDMEDIGIIEFMENVIGHASSVELILANNHLNNFMSLTAPVNDAVNQLFKWPNNFAWSYDGDVTDSIKERVKRAGGDVDAKLRVSLAWFNYDDLDIHVIEPDRNRIYYGNKSGKLDVDMNAGFGTHRDAVENVRWNGDLHDGFYKVLINQYSKRENVDLGFVLEVEYNGNIQNFSYDFAVLGDVQAIDLKVQHGELIDIIAHKGIVSGSAKIDKWGIATQERVRVNTIMNSPNHWDGNDIGNKHWFFILEGCKNPMETRGIYNEFLHSDLEKHRKVFEILGSQTKCPITENQLSGVGFSSTKRENVAALVKSGKRQKLYNVKF